MPTRSGRLTQSSKSARYNFKGAMQEMQSRNRGRPALYLPPMPKQKDKQDTPIFHPYFVMDENTFLDTGRRTDMNHASIKKQRLPRVVHWRSASGKWVVVAGPFPDLFSRSETRDDPEKASKALVDNVYTRGPTTRDDQYAKVLAADILEILSGTNEFGPVVP